MNTVKPLPVIRNLESKLDFIFLKQFRSFPEGGNYSPDLLKQLSEEIGYTLGIDKDKIYQIAKEYIGLSHTNISMVALSKQICKWLPALKAGYAYAPDRSTIDTIPHTVLLQEPNFDSKTEQWRLTVTVLDGPLRSTVIQLLTNYHIACSMLRCAFGYRLLRTHGQMRPPDLHNAKILVHLRPRGDTLYISKLLSTPVAHQWNKALKGRFAPCAKQKYSILCFDCGAGEIECPLARHKNRLSEKECTICKKVKPVYPSGVCVHCVQYFLSTGVPLTSVKDKS